MGISFLAPLFFVGFAALAVPIFIHLTHRERKDVVAFPSLMFLRRIPYRTVRRQRIRHWLLFLLRCAAIVLLVTAFSRPLFDGARTAVENFSSAREVVILLDRSHSMAYGERWRRAEQAAGGIIDGLGAEDRATLVLFDERAEAATQRTADRLALRAALEETNFGYGVTRYGPAIQLASEIIERSDRPGSQVVLVTDFQKVGWDPHTAVRLPQGTELVAVDVSEGDAANLVVMDASLRRSREAEVEAITVSARVANMGGESVDAVPVVLEVDGEVVQTKPIRLGPNASEIVYFAPFNLPQRSVRGIVRAGSDPLPSDNAFHFVIEPETPLPILVIEPRGADANHSLYLRRALEIGSRPGFEVAIRRLSQLSPADLDGRTIVILNGAPFPRGSAGAKLRAILEGGGGILAALGRRTTTGAWPDAAGDLLPGRYSAPLDRSSDGGATLGFIDYDHPAFELFRAPRSGDFTPARFFRYRRFESSGSAAVLARFDDGSIALTESRHGDGRMLVLTSDLENFWNNLPIQPVFLPFAHQLVRYLAGYVEPASSFTVGEVVDLSSDKRLARLELLALDGESEGVIEGPSGERSVLAADDRSVFVHLSEPGFFSIRQIGEGSNRISTLASNLDPLESDLGGLDPEELTSAVVAGGETRATSVEALLTAEERERRQGLWWYLLVGAALFLLAETVLSNRLPRMAT